MMLSRMSSISPYFVHSLITLILLPQMAFVVTTALLQVPPIIIGGPKCAGATTNVWGGNGTLLWEVRIPPGGFLKEIKGKFDAVINSLTFTLVDSFGHKTRKSFGGRGGVNDSSIQLEKGELIMGIKGVHAKLVGHCERDLATLYVETNKRGWLGPIGNENYTGSCRQDNVDFSLSLRNGSIGRFYGTYNNYINSVGVFLRAYEC